jgi:hypothetical protein
MAETLEYLTVCRAPRLRTRFEQAHAREKALDDLTSGGCDAFMKLRSTACRDFPQDDLGHLKIVAFRSLAEASADAFAIFCSAVLAHFPLALEPRDGEATTDDAAQHGFDKGIGRI